MKIKLGFQGKDGVPQKPPQSTVVVPANTPKPTPCGVHPEFKHRAAKVVGVIYVVTGVIGVIVATVAHIMMRDGCGFAMHGGFIAAIITGGLGLGAAVKKTRGLIIALLVFAIITLIMSTTLPVKSLGRHRHHDRHHHGRHHHRPGHDSHERDHDSREKREATEEPTESTESKEELDKDDRDHRMRGKHGKHGKQGMTWDEIRKMKERFHGKYGKWDAKSKEDWAAWMKKKELVMKPGSKDASEKHHMKPEFHKSLKRPGEKPTDQDMPPMDRSRKSYKMMKAAVIAMGVLHLVHLVVSIVAIVLSCKVVGCCRKRPRRNACEEYKVPSTVVINVDASSPVPEELSPKLLAEQMYMANHSPPTSHQEELPSSDKPPTYGDVAKTDMTNVSC